MSLTQIDDRGLKTPIDLIDNEKIRLGTGNDLQIYHDGSHSYIHNTTGDLIIKAAFPSIRGDNDEIIFTAGQNGAVELRYDNVKKFETTSAGVSVTGDFSTSGDVKITGDGTGCKLEIGASSDLQAYHNGGHNYLDSLSTAELRIRVKENESAIIAKPDGAVELYYDNAKMFYTHTAGAIIKRPSGGDTELSIYGSEGNNAALKLASDDGDDNDDYYRLIAKTNHDFALENYRSGGWETNLTCTGNGAVDLYHDNAKVFYTQDYGGTFKRPSGGATVLEVIGSEGNNAELQLRADDGDDEHDLVKLVASDSSGLYIQTRDTSAWKTNARFINGGAVELYYDNSKKFNTYSGGTYTYGECNIVGAEGVSASLYLIADEGDDNGDGWRINSNQDVSDLTIASNTSGSYSDKLTLAHTGMLAVGPSSSATYNHDFRTNSNNNWTATFRHATTDSNPHGIWMGYSVTPDDSSHPFLMCDDNTTNRFRVNSDGDVQNHDNSYGATSDVKLKENIVDAGSQWNDIKAVKVRNFNFKINKSKTLIGVVAQELETVSPGLVSEIPDKDSELNDLGTTTKAVKYSVLYMKAIKALQEAMAKIETLETKVAALEAA